MPSRPKKVPVSLRIIDEYEGEVTGQQHPENLKAHFEDLYTWFYKMPELRYAATTLVDDIMGEGFELHANTEEKETSTHKWLRKIKFNRNLYACLLDYVITGNGYLGKAFVKRDRIMGLIDRVWHHQFNKSCDELSKFDICEKIKQENPDFFLTRNVFPLKSKNIFIDYDEHGTIKSFVQKIRAHTVFGTDDTKIEGDMNREYRTVKFDPKEIIHFAYEPVGDDIYGSSPFMNSLFEIAALFYAKNYGGVFFQNSATPTYIFKMPDETPESANYKTFKEELKKHRKQPHKNLLMTGNVEIERVNPLNKDMEFGKFIDKFTQTIFMPLGITPKSKHMFAGERQIQNMTSLEGYYKRVNRIQKEIEDELNTGLFDQFDVEFRFKRVYKRDESREADIVSKLVNIVWTINESRKYLGLKPLDDPAFDMIDSKKEPSAQFISETGAADARTEQSINNPSAPYQPKEKLPPRGTGLRTGRAGRRSTGIPRTDEERARRHAEKVAVPKEVERIWKSAYYPCTEGGKYSKERCAKMAWGAVKHAGWRKDKKGVWRKR